MKHTHRPNLLAVVNDLGRSEDESRASLPRPSRTRFGVRITPLLGSIAALLLCGNHHVSAIVPVTDATWNSNPGSGDWNTDSNWTPATAPNSSSSTATFGASAVTGVSLSTGTTVSGIVFSPGSGAFTISTNNNFLDFEGFGVLNNSGVTQNFVVAADKGGEIQFFNSASAGSKTIYTVNGTTSGGEGSAGRIWFLNTSDAGSAKLIANGGQQGGGIFFANDSTGGKAAVEVYGNGFVDISHHNEGSVTIGSLAGSGQAFLGSNNLTVGSNDLSTVFSGVIQDGGEGGGTGGSLTKIGRGVLTLSGANTYTGSTVVNGGSLLVDGSIVSPQTYVNAGGTLGGIGFIGGDVFNAGNVQPGDDPGTLTIKGNYRQSKFGTLTIVIGNIHPGNYDLLVVGGQAKLDGTLRLEQLGKPFHLKVGKKLTFLTAAGGVDGTFASVDNQLHSGTIIDYEVVYDPKAVSIEAVQGSFKEYALFAGLTPNQVATAAWLDNLYGAKHTGELFRYLDSRPLGDLPHDFDKIAPEELTAIFTLGTALDLQQTLNIQRRTDDIRNGGNGFSAAGLAINGDRPSFSGAFGITTGVAGPTGDSKESKEIKNVAPVDQRWGSFLSGTGEWVNVTGTDNARGYNLQSGGFTLGVDYKIAPNFAVGLMAGYNGDIANLTEGGRIWVNGGKVGLYSTISSGGWYADASVLGGYSSYDTRRSALQGFARGDTDGGDINAFFGTGYEIKKGGLTFGPTATFNFTYVGINGFTEHGSLAPLDIQGHDSESLRSAFGFKASYDWKLGGILIKPELRVAWQHEYGDSTYTMSSSFAGGGNSTFGVSGPRLGRDSALVGAGFAIQCSERCSTYLYYDGELGRTNYTSNSVTGGVRVSF